jgi:hypothetical protein
VTSFGRNDGSLVLVGENGQQQEQRQRQRQQQQRQQQQQQQMRGSSPFNRLRVRTTIVFDVA